MLERCAGVGHEQTRVDGEQRGRYNPLDCVLLTCRDRHLFPRAATILKRGSVEEAWLKRGN